MEHIGIDLGATHSHIVITKGNGKLRRTKVRTASLPSWLAARPPSRVVMEACTQSPAIAAAALASKHEVRVVPGQVVRALGVGARGIKTDDRDAEVLARASVRSEDLPSVHIRSPASAERRGLIASRGLLLKARASLSVNVKSWLRGRLTRMVGRADSLAFVEAARALALEHPEGLPPHIDALLHCFEALTKQIDALTEQLEEQATADEDCRRSQTMPGVGPVVSMAFKATLDDPNRFASASQVASYLALVPGECTTGGHIKRTSTIKAGPRHLKSLLVQAAWSMFRTRRNDPLVLWATALADKRGKRVAIVALARKIAVILWSMWKHHKDYDPVRAAASHTERKDIASGN